MKIYKVDDSKSKIQWEATTKNGEVIGHMKFSEGKLISELGELLEGIVVVNLNSLQIDEKAVDEQDSAKVVSKTESNKFLDSSEFPTATFRFDRVKNFSHQNETRGTLEFKDKAYSFSVPLNIKKENGNLRAKSQFTIKEVNPTLFKNLFANDDFLKQVEKVKFKVDLRANLS